MITERTLVEKGRHKTVNYAEQGVIYDSTRLGWGLGSISFKCYYQLW